MVFGYLAYLLEKKAPAVFIRDYQIQNFLGPGFDVDTSIGKDGKTAQMTSIGAALQFCPLQRWFSKNSLKLLSWYFSDIIAPHPFNLDLAQL